MHKTLSQPPSNHVFVHIDAAGAYQGNGGFLMLSLLANHLVDIGYAVSVFDVDDRLTDRAWDWCDLDHIWFDIARWGDVVSPLETGPIITSWLVNALDKFRLHPAFVRRLRYWCHDELLRVPHQASREFIARNPIPVAITNACWRDSYDAMGIRVDAVLPLWIRDMFIMQPGDKPGLAREHLLGYQMDVNGDAVLRQLHDAGIEPLLCHGTQTQVAAKMKQCRFFLQWNAFKPLMVPGEGWGLSAFEAAVAGCTPLVRKHPGNCVLPDALRFDSLETVITKIHDPGYELEIAQRNAQSAAGGFLWSTGNESGWRKFISGEY